MRSGCIIASGAGKVCDRPTPQVEKDAEDRRRRASHSVSRCEPYIEEKFGTDCSNSLLESISNRGLGRAEALST